MTAAVARSAQSRGLRIHQIAAAAGMTPQNLSLFLAGTRGISIRQAERLAEAAGALIIIQPASSRRPKPAR